MIRRIIRKPLLKLLRWTHLYKNIDELIKSQKRDFHHLATYHDAVFHTESRVANIQNDASKIQIGDGTNVRGELLILAYGGFIKVGKYCYIGDHTRIWSGDSITIGDNVLISHNVNIIDTNSHEMDSVERADGYKSLLFNGYPSKKGNVLTSPIVIKDNAWISFNAIILKGVTIGKGAVVAAGSVVSKDVPDYAVVAGNPARIIKYTT
jgi:acetyltransferase-like isoleucine patch superfamily enzyme